MPPRPPTERAPKPSAPGKAGGCATIASGCRTEKSARKTIDFLDETVPDQILLSLATAYPGTDLWGGPYIDMHENWIAKFHGHGTGGRLYLPKGITRREYAKLADYMWAEVKRINKAREEAAG